MPQQTVVRRGGRAHMALRTFYYAFAPVKVCMDIASGVPGTRATTCRVVRLQNSKLAL
jgi:hypothetical protein